MEQTEEAATEAEAERDTRFGFKCERRIVESELFERIAKIWIFRTVGGIYSRKTIGSACLNPSKGSAVGFSASVTVSPTRVSATFFMLAVIYPTSPARMLSAGTRPKADM